MLPVLTILRPVKATFLALLAVSVALALPGLSLADETPNPAFSACKAEYVQLIDLDQSSPETFESIVFTLGQATKPKGT